MEFEVFDVVKFEKEKAIARYNRFRRIAKLWQFLQVLVLLGLFTWSSAPVAAALKTAAAQLVKFSTFLLNHHVVFLIGNAIIVLLFVLFRHCDADAAAGGGGDDLYGDYVKHSDAAANQPSPTEEEKQIVLCTAEEDVTETAMAAATKDASLQCDDVAAIIEKATRQIKKFERTQSEKLKREISVRPLQAELRRSETQSRRRSDVSGERLDAAEIERLSSEEFQRTVEAFIGKHWSKKAEMK